MRARMATNQEMMTTENMTLAEQMELGSVTMCCWPTPIEQLTCEGVMELGLSTMNSWQEIEPSVMQEFWDDALSNAYTKPKPKSWADQVSDDDEIDWDQVEDFLPPRGREVRSWSEVAWGRCHCGCENNETRFGAPSSLGM